MKLILFVLSAAIFTTGCSQPKNRLTDDKNTQYQEKLAKISKMNQSTERHTVDVPASPEANVSNHAPNEQSSEMKTDVKKEEINHNVLTVPDRAELVIEEKVKKQTETSTPAPQAQPSTDENTSKLNQEVKKVDTAASREDAKNKIAKAAGMTEVNPKNDEAKKDEEGTKVANKLSILEVRSILTQVYLLLEDQQSTLQTIQEYNSEGSGISFDKLNFKLDMNSDGANIEVSYENKVLAKFEKVQLKYNSPRVKTSNEISLLSVCANENCDLMMLTFRKATNGKLIYNFPLYLKIVDDHIVRFFLKSSEEYSQESKETAASDAEKPATSVIPPLDFTEYSSILEQLTRTEVVKSDDELNRIRTLYVSPNLKMDSKKFATATGSKEDGIIFSVVYDGKIITGAKNVKLKFGEAFKTKTDEDYNFNAVCGNDKCNVIFAAFTKIEKNKTVLNVPFYYRVINGRIVPVKIKSNDEYSAEAREKLKSDKK